MSSQEHIRELCVRVLAAQGTDFSVAVADLQAALKAHNENLRVMAATALLKLRISETDPPRRS
jgi:hypothetical protein